MRVKLAAGFRVAGLLLCFVASAASATFHTFVIEELYSSPDGSVQFIVLHESLGFDGENLLAGHTLTSTSGVTTRIYTFPSNLPNSLTANKRVLIATQGFANLGIVAPDYIVPTPFLFPSGGTLNYAAVDSFTYPALPANGVDALYRTGVVALNVATNFAGQIGSIEPAPCDVFTDVVATDNFCPAVQWLKNRSITTGCAAGMYCPANNVTRAQMALFMNRLGNALSPEVLGQFATPGAAAVPSVAPFGTYCVTGDSTVAAHPRAAIINTTFSGLADGAIAWKSGVLYSTDGGATWSQVPTGILTSASSAMNEWSLTTGNVASVLTPGLAYRFAIFLVRDDVVTGTTGNFANSICQLTASIYNQNGVSPPY